MIDLHVSIWQDEEINEILVETFYILQENANRIILEDDSGFILLEDAP